MRNNRRPLTEDEWNAVCAAPIKGARKTFVEWFYERRGKSDWTYEEIRTAGGELINHNHRFTLNRELRKAGVKVRFSEKNSIYGFHPVN